MKNFLLICIIKVFGQNMPHLIIVKANFRSEILDLNILLAYCQSVFLGTLVPIKISLTSEGCIL